MSVPAGGLSAWQTASDRGARGRSGLRRAQRAAEL